MQLLFRWGFCLLFWVPLVAQSDRPWQIQYETTFTVDTTAVQEFVKTDLQLGINDFDSQAYQAYRALIDASNARVERQTYIYSDTLIRMIREQNQVAPDEWVGITPQSGAMRIYATDLRGDKHLQEIALYQPASAWIIRYDIQHFPEDTTTILGFPCYRMEVVQHRMNARNNREERDYYQLYVTDALPLPASVVIPLWEPEVSVCPLEIQYFHSTYRHRTAVCRAIAIERVSPVRLQLPRKFWGLY